MQGGTVFATEDHRPQRLTYIPALVLLTIQLFFPLFGMHDAFVVPLSLSIRQQCLTVQLFEHQLQAANWMYDHEMLDGGAMQHLWAELPPHPEAPAVSYLQPSSNKPTGEVADRDSK